MTNAELWADFQRHKKIQRKYEKLTKRQRVWVHELLHAVSGLAVGTQVKEISVYREADSYGGYCEWLKGQRYGTAKQAVTASAPYWFFSGLNMANSYEYGEASSVDFVSAGKHKVIKRFVRTDFREAVYAAAKKHWRKSKLTAVAECPLIQEAVAILKKRRKLW